jgi:hypothetical protein
MYSDVVRLYIKSVIVRYIVDMLGGSRFRVVDENVGRRVYFSFYDYRVSITSRLYRIYVFLTIPAKTITNDFPSSKLIIQIFLLTIPSQVCPRNFYFVKDPLLVIAFQVSQRGLQYCYYSHRIV